MRLHHQGGHIHCRKTKTHGVVHVIMYRQKTPDGTWKQISETVPTRYRKEAEKVLAERLAGVNLGKRLSTGITFGEFVREQWQSRLADMKPSTQKSHCSNVNNHLLPALGGLELREIRTEQLRELLEKKRQAGMSDKSRQNLYLLLASMFNYAVDLEVIEASPVRAKALRPKVRQQEKPTLAPKQIQAVVAAVPLPMRALFVLLSLTGLRIGEVLGLKWKDVDFENGILHVRRSIWMGKEQTPKSDHSIRAKYMGGILKHTLETHRMFSHYTNSDDYLFCAGNGHPLFADDLRKRVLYPAMDRAGVERTMSRSFGFHLFRHSAGTELQQATGNLKATSTFLGHAGIAITADTYAHTTTDAERADMLKLEQVMFPAGTLEIVPQSSVVN